MQEETPKVPPGFSNEVAVRLIGCYMENEVEIAYLVESKALRTLKEINAIARNEGIDHARRIELIKNVLSVYPAIP